MCYSRKVHDHAVSGAVCCQHIVERYVTESLASASVSRSSHEEALSDYMHPLARCPSTKLIKNELHLWPWRKRRDVTCKASTRSH